MERAVFFVNWDPSFQQLGIFPGEEAEEEAMEADEVPSWQCWWWFDGWNMIPEPLEIRWEIKNGGR